MRAETLFPMALSGTLSQTLTMPQGDFPTQAYFTSTRPLASGREANEGQGCRKTGWAVVGGG